jgi:hypothetical protein
VTVEPAASGGGRIDFLALATQAGSKEGGRASFELLVHDLVALHNRGARRLDGRGGDWGIDTYVGELDGGEIAVWQAKYFVDGMGDVQQRQVAKAIESVEENARVKGFKLGAWTLCVACDLTPTETIWWSGFKKRNEKGLGIRVVLWPASQLRGLLLAPDAEPVRSQYFGPLPPPSPLPARDLVDQSAYEQALFVAQLREAGIAEVASAKQQFFNAELLTREVTDKGVTEELAELGTRRAEVHAIWETRFNKYDQLDVPDRLPGLHPEVMEAVEIHHRSCRPQFLRAGLVHTLGLVHQQVQDRRAGWTRKWRDVAAGFDD